MENLLLHASTSNAFSGFTRSFQEARYVVLGVPYDHTSTYRVGSRFAPRAIRDASLNIETYSMRTGVEIERIPLHDAGDLHIVDDPSETLRRLTSATGEILSAGKIAICIGGEHTISLGVVRNLTKSVGVISFDAHGDLRDEYGGGKLSHATVLRRITEILSPEAVYVCGIRAVCGEEVDFMERQKIRHLTPWELREFGLHKATESLKSFAKVFSHIYLTIDADVLDPAYAPGVANPEFDGLTPAELISLISAVANERTIGLDLVEVCPNYDTGATSVAAARLIFETISHIEKARAG